MTEKERFESIVAPLRADRRWVRRILWLRATSRLTWFVDYGLPSMALIANLWIPGF
jgi:hypothetical protein